ncbi:DNA-binding protein, histone-like, putative [Reichenbachiella agariperforans]|uniref:DNA-binding protein, histone-like, putative n=1 Tax=Reichenbachiella agariperforans TaxID=156994 RepID=A0A1M6U856_REIAG|nr:hypothetical protein [Reichenbachiella agariperforans]SHK65351.1 DNA-binding protein, histone-like, putative [Reichenbachiella agariperforans]
MSVKFKAIPKGYPGVVGGGVTKYYANIVRGEKIDFRDLLVEIEELNVVHPGVFLAVLEAFLRKTNQHLLNGRAVHLGQLGTFYPSISSSSAESEDEVSSNSIRRFKIIYRPSALLQEGLDHVKFEKVSDASREENAA